MSDWVKEEYNKMQNSNEVKTVVDRFSVIYENRIQENKKIIENLKQKILNDMKKYDSYIELVSRYSTFSVCEICPIIADIISVYIARKTWFDTKHTYYKFISQGPYSPVDIVKFPEKEITFYNFDVKQDYNGLSSELIKRESHLFKYYPFLVGFIDYVIEYRMENGLDEVSVEVLEELKQNYIKLHIEEINEIHGNMNDKDEVRLKNEYDNIVSYRKKLISNVFK